MIDESKFAPALERLKAENIKLTDLCKELNLNYDDFHYFICSRHPELLNKQKIRPLSDYNKEKKQAAAKKYENAIKLYETTELNIKEIAKQTEVSYEGLRSYIQTHHRDLMLRRHNIEMSKRQANTVKVRTKSNRQSKSTHDRYKDAVAACDSEEYIKITVSEIAQIFHVHPVGLWKELHVRYPEVIERREKARFELGIVEKSNRGVRKSTEETYAKAVELLKDPSITLVEAANLTGVKLGGLKNYLRLNKKDLLKEREQIREASIGRTGGLSGNGGLRKKKEATDEKYREAMNMMQSSSLSIKQICKDTNTPHRLFLFYLEKWHNDFLSAYKEKLQNQKQEALDNKYEEAVKKLGEEGTSIEKVAKECGFHPEVLRAYLKKHKPDLFNKFGSVILDNGKKVRTESAAKYAQAVEDLRNNEGVTLKEIAERNNVRYNSFTRYLRRNFPEFNK